MEAFVQMVSLSIPPPLLQAPLRNAKRIRCPRRPRVSTRRSLRIAAKDWPRGDTQAKARHVLMKKVGVPEDEVLSPDDRFLRYFSMFQGPLFGEVVKAMTALCGLDEAPIIDVA